MTTTVRILGSRAREQVPGTSITLLAPGFRGALTQLTPGVVNQAAFDLPFAEAAAGAEVMLAAQLTLQLEARPPSSVAGLRLRSAMVTHPRVIVPRRPGVTYAVLQTDETGTSSFLLPQPGDDSEAVFLLTVAAQASTRRTLRVLMWPELPPAVAAAAVPARWEQLRRPCQLAQRSLTGPWQQPDWPALAGGPVLLLLHDTFSTPQATFADWLDDESFARLAGSYQGRCLAYSHPTLSAGVGENLDWLVTSLASIPGPFDVVAHGRGGLLARTLAADQRLPLRRVCQVGTPNRGTPLASGSLLPQFLDAHVCLLARLPKVVAQGTLEGALCLARLVAQGLRGALPGIDALTPESAAVSANRDLRVPGLEWFTVGAQFTLPEGHMTTPGPAEAFASVPNDLVVPAHGCHEPGFPVTDSLHVPGVHHHGYFSDARVRERLAMWLM
ncbi:MAG TPA: hypothetical protein VF033_17435 [Steroidobacteraceae bacterium]